MDRININQIHAKLLTQIMVEFNISTIHSNPGLRNAPLLHAIANESKLKLTHHFDERATAYRALAEAKLTGKPSLLLCTSGTAVANYFPAIIEAYFQEIPLIVISSDRPSFSVKGLGNQSIYQDHIFGNYTPNSLQAIEPSLKGDMGKWTKQLLDFFNNATLSAYPSHLNISFLDPANSIENSVTSNDAAGILRDFETNMTEIRNRSWSTKPTLSEGSEESRKSKDNLLNTNEIELPDLISIGELPTSTEPELLQELKNLIQNTRIPINLDINSHLKYQFLNHSHYIPSLDHPEAAQWIQEQGIKNIWHFGNRMTSKRYYNLLKSLDCQVTNFTNSKHNFNPANAKTKKFHLSKSNMIALQKIDIPEKAKPNFKDIIQLKRHVIESENLSFPYISKWIVEQFIQKDDLLVLGNSTTIRSFDFFADIKEHINPRIYSHRGASGIEGLVASLQGAREVENTTFQRIIAVIGDITALHDFNSFFLLKQNLLQGIPLHLFIVNDFGGGIFRLLNVPEMQNCKEAMETPHNIEMTSLLERIFDDKNYCHLHKIIKKEQLNSVVNNDSVVKNDLKNNQGISIYEILLDEVENNKVYRCLKTIQSQSQK